MLLTACATPQPSVTQLLISKSNFAENITADWGRGHWDKNSSKVGSSYTYAIDFKILADFLLELSHSQDFPKSLT